MQNDASGVTLEIQGEMTAEFINELLAALPPLAKISTIHAQHINVNSKEQQFKIITSQSGKISTIVSPDTAICESCLTELFDPNSRYYHYPFLNCTQCGPRITITQQLPFDRDATVMTDFPMCAACQQDYHNPANRRFHAQAIACQQCGPTLAASIEDIANRIRQGQIVAIKGLGGYQLICDAHNTAAIAKLREKKQRKQKPLATMLLNLASAKYFADVELLEQQNLISAQRPIVLLKKTGHKLPDNIAPELAHIGIMLPYLPVHYLLFHALLGYPNSYGWLEQQCTTALIVTSANVIENPIIINDGQAQHELNDMADGVVSHNRTIVTRMDDSVLRVINQTPCLIRRARGYVPLSIKLPRVIPPTLALGGYLKNTFCITRDDEAFLSQHIGDLKNKETRDAYHESLQHWLTFLGVKPECVVHDLHPDFYTTHLANEFDLPTIAVQHHHAHLAAVAAEYHIQKPVLGLALDGHGYGVDGGAWGGELLLLDHITIQRLAHLQPLILPSGDKATREPWYMGASVLHMLGCNNEITRCFSNQAGAALLAALLEKNINLPRTSSCGRLFDAAAALLGVHHNNQYEGQAAMKLESLVTRPEIMQDGWSIAGQELSLLPLLQKLLNLDPISGANLFHGTLIAALTDLVILWSKKMAINRVLLSGGCFLNKVLSEGLITSLTQANIEVLLPKQVPPNDGGIALGQAWIGGLSCV